MFWPQHLHKSKVSSTKTSKIFSCIVIYITWVIGFVPRFSLPLFWVFNIAYIINYFFEIYLVFCLLQFIFYILSFCWGPIGISKMPPTANYWMRASGIAGDEASTCTSEYSYPAGARPACSFSANVRSVSVLSQTQLTSLHQHLKHRY